MEAIIYYVKVNIVFAVFFGIYASTMRKETGFHARRACLLALPFLALTIPFLQVPALSALDMPSIELPAMTVNPSVDPDQQSTLLERIILLHLVVSAFLLLALIIRIERTLRALRSGLGEAGSFFGHVHVPLGLPSTDHATILEHEHVHVREKHTFDVLLYEVLSAFFWSVPLWRIALRESIAWCMRSSRIGTYIPFTPITRACCSPTAYAPQRPPSITRSPTQP